ncbi:adenylyl cyclase [Rhizoclosmatium globosum]|uniref:Adenylyl cyclase n=1 Tax=Rhizoclosmatium globosum TaxID=329046 RepID=A0A1Y2CCF6_9FUNG|nr:adenylyl cyclase [Rhizoclosmatium globosum]|eukprot:ORY44730.1 adenylyl cyclase [Rhizoclosmatium globosum]
MSDLLKDHEDEIEQIKVEQASMMNELMSAQVADDASAVEESLVSTLSSVLPYHIMMSFQRGINPQPDDYSSTITPANTLKLINGIFPIFDKIVQRYSLLYKVESASEVYLVAGGITETSEKTAQEMSQFTAQILNCAKELQALAAQFNFSPFAGTHPVKLRFGIHSGPTCAGLVGTKVCKYGLFGDGINTATRVCGKSEPGKIQVTTEVIAALGEDDKFEFEERGDVEIKVKYVFFLFLFMPNQRNRGKGS